MVQIYAANIGMLRFVLLFLRTYIWSVILNVFWASFVDVAIIQIPSWKRGGKVCYWKNTTSFMLALTKFFNKNTIAQLFV